MSDNTLLDAKGKPVKIPAVPRSLAKHEHIVRAIGTVIRMLWRDEISNSKALALGSLLKIMLADKVQQERQMLDPNAIPITEVNVIISDDALREEIYRQNHDIIPAPDEEPLDGNIDDE